MLKHPLFVAVALFAIIVFLGLAVTSCHQCKSGTMRCDGNRVQLCAPNHRWKTVVNCSKLNRTNKQHVCVKISEDRRSCRVKNGQEERNSNPNE